MSCAIAFPDWALPAPRAKRIVALAPSLSEWAYEIQRETNCCELVGVSDASELTGLPLQGVKRIGPMHQLNLEQIMQLKPDVALATEEGNSKSQVERLKSLGVSVIIVKSQSLEDIRAGYEEVERGLTGESKIAQLKWIQFKKDLSNLHVKTSQTKTVVTVGRHPLVVVGSQNYINDLLKEMGLMNVYGSEERRFPRPSLEDIARRAPDMIFVLGMGNSVSEDEVASDFKALLKTGRLKRNQIKILKSDSILRPTFHSIEGVKEIHQAIEADMKTSKGSAS